MRARAHACARGVLVEGGARRCARKRATVTFQLSSTGLFRVSTKLNLPPPVYISRTGAGENARAMRACAHIHAHAHAQANTARTCAQPTSRSSMAGGRCAGRPGRGPAAPIAKGEFSRAALVFHYMYRPIASSIGARVDAQTRIYLLQQMQLQYIQYPIENLGQQEFSRNPGILAVV